MKQRPIFLALALAFSQCSQAYAAGNISENPVEDTSYVVHNGETIDDYFLVGGYHHANSGPARATGNSVVVEAGGTVQGNVIGAEAYSGNDDATATGNSVTVSGTVTDNVYGGWADGNGSGKVSEASGNTVTIDGGTVGESVFGGASYVDNGSETGWATNNTVRIKGSANIGGDVYGGFAGRILAEEADPSKDAFTGNTLDKQSDAAVNTARNFENVNFGYEGDANIGTLDTSPGGSKETTVKLSNAKDIVFAGRITGNGGIEKRGAGTLALQNTGNDYEGDTTVSEGLINFNSADNFGEKGKITLDGGGLQWADGNSEDISGRLNPIGAGGGTFDTNGNDVTLAGRLSGGKITKEGDGALELTDKSNDYDGAAVNGGALEGDAASLSGDIALSNGARVVFRQYANDAAGRYDGIIGGDGALEKTGDGELILSGDNSHTGGTKVDAGQATAASDTAFGTGTVTMADGTTLGVENRTIANAIALNGTAKIDTGNGASRLSGEISGAGELEKTGGGLLTLTHANTYSGGTKIVEGQIAAGDDAALGTGTVTIEDFGMLGFEGDRKIANDIALEGMAIVTTGRGKNAADATLSGNITGDGKLNKNGDGDLTLSGDNDYSGGTIIDEGRLVVASDTALGTGEVLMMSQTGLALDGARTIANDITLNGASAKTIDTGADDSTLSGKISGTGALEKLGDGRLTLSNADNDYSGDTTVSAGRLELAGALTESPVTVLRGAALSIKGWAGKDVTVNGGGTMDVYSGGGIGGNLLAAGGNLNFYVPKTMGNGETLLSVGGRADVNGSTVNVGIDGASSPLQEGDEIYLIDADGGLSGTTNAQATGEGMQGVSLLYTFDITTDANRLVASLPKSSAPTDPADPENPANPTNPDDPSNPTNPDSPSNPTNPDSPTNPTNPDDPTNPTNPDNPSNPTDPSNPTNPDSPTNPDDPTNPDNPSNPTNPTDPTNPDNPTDPANPADPASPLRPAKPIRVNPQTKALAEGYLSGVALVNQGVDRLDGLRGKHGRGVFVLVDGASVKHKTGSSVNVDSAGVLAGVSGEMKTAPGVVSLAAFFSHGKGDYDTANSFSNAASVKGKGQSEYSGVGALGRIDFNATPRGHAYAEASVQAGRVSTDFRSRDLVDSQGRGAKYDTKSSYLGAHVGGGYVLKQGPGELDLYGKYLHAWRAGDHVKLSTGDPIHFGAVQSRRVRIGARYDWTVNTVKPYVGLAYEREFDGKARAKTYGHKIDAPDMKGNTGILEAGLTMTPSKTKPLTIDIGLKGYFGKREGVSGGVKLEYRF
jgi:autotransporter-associated beta strand protein